MHEAELNVGNRPPLDGLLGDSGYIWLDPDSWHLYNNSATEVIQLCPQFYTHNCGAKHWCGETEVALPPLWSVSSATKGMKGYPGLLHAWSTGGDIRSLVGCHPKEELYWGWVTLVVFSDYCSYSTYAVHPLLSTMPPTDDNVGYKVAESDKWASLPESRPPLRPSTNPPRTLLCIPCWGLSCGQGEHPWRYILQKLKHQPISNTSVYTVLGFVLQT